MSVLYLTVSVYLTVSGFSVHPIFFLPMNIFSDKIFFLPRNIFSDKLLFLPKNTFFEGTQLLWIQKQVFGVLLQKV